MSKHSNTAFNVLQFANIWLYGRMCTSINFFYKLVSIPFCKPKKKNCTYATNYSYCILFVLNICMHQFVSRILSLVKAVVHLSAALLEYFELFMKFSVMTRQLCSKFYLLCYAALLKNFTYYAQNYAHSY